MRAKKILIYLSLVLFLLLSLGSAFAAPDYTTDASAYYIFKGAADETTALTDLSGNSLDLTNDGATWSSGEGFSFDGTNDFLEATTTGDVALDIETSDFIISAWVEFDNDLVTDNYFANKRGSSGWFIGPNVADKVTLYAAATGEPFLRTTDDEITTATLIHICTIVDFDSTAGNKIYINGVSEGLNNNVDGSSSVTDTEPMQIGQDHSGAFWAGDVESFHVFKGSNIAGDYDSTGCNDLYTQGSEYNPFGTQIIEVSSLYLDPNTSVTIDDTIDGTINFNQSLSGAYVWTQTFINGALDDLDNGSNTYTGTSYTFEAFSVGEFVGNDDLIASFKLVNSSNTSQVFIDWINTTTLTIDNTAPNSSQARIEPFNPQNFENLNATCLVDDRDGDSFDINIEVYKNTVLLSNTSAATKTLVSGNIYKGNVVIANTSFTTGDSLQVKCRGYDGSDYGAYTTSSLYSIVAELMTTTVSANETSPISHNSDFIFTSSSTFATANTSITPDYTLTDVYKNGVFFKNSTTIYANETNINDNFTFYSYVSLDGRKLSITKSITVNIGNTAPQVTSAYLNPIPPQDADTLLTYCSITDADADLMNLTYKIYRNGISISTGSQNNIANGTYNVVNISDTSTTIGDVFVVECALTDGYLSTATNSSVYTILADNLQVELVSDNAEFVLPTYYARSLEYVTRYNNCTTSGVAHLYVNNVSVRSLSFSCDAGGEDYYFNGTYQHSSEQNATLRWQMELTNGTNYNFSRTYLYDLLAPVATIDPQQINNGFGGNNNVSVSLTCTDSLYSPLRNVYLINGVVDFNTSYASGYIYNDSINLPDGTTNLSFSCYDLFSSDTETYSYTAYTKQFQLVDEVTGADFDITNLTYARLWFGDDSAYFDFVANATNTVNVTGTTITDLRLVYHLSDDSIITRFIDMQYLPDGELDICINKDNVAHYEQLFSASSPKPVIVKNQYADCYIAADETKFAYQDSLILRAYTIDSVYYLYTYTDGSQVFLSSLDGSVQSSVNIDVLEFSQEAYNFNVLQSAVTFSETDGGDVKIQYVNNKGDNTKVTVTIIRTDTGDTVFSTSNLDDPNEFYLVFSTSSLSDVTSSTLFKAVFFVEKEGGSTQTLTRYFNNSGSNGTLNPTFAAIFAAVLIFFGMSLTVTRVSFSWFGSVILIGALVILGLTTNEFYIIVLQAATSIILVFTFIIMYKSNSETIA